MAKLVKVNMPKVGLREGFPAVSSPHPQQRRHHHGVGIFLRV
jgi:hypothetical protein